MGQMSREKGKRGEREAAKALSEALGVSARRGVQFSGGPGSPDVVTTLEGVHFEVKRSERFNLYQAMDQAEADSDGAVPVVLHRRNLRPWVVCVELDRLEEFVELVSGRGGEV